MRENKLRSPSSKSDSKVGRKMHLHRCTLTAVLALGLLPGSALAHGFGSRYELPLPPWLFFAGAVLVVVVSFALVSVFSGHERNSFSYTSIQLAATPLWVVTTPAVVRIAKTVTVLLLGFGVLVGIIGPQSYASNVFTLLVWVGWWVGYTFSVIFIGNTWPVLNPWKVIYERSVSLLGRDPSLRREYTWGALPALGLLFGFGWVEIVSPLSKSPRALAVLTLAYSIVTWGGMLVYGKEVWLENADPFTRLYRYLGKFAPVSLEKGGEIRPYGVGLVERDESLHATGALAFLVAILYLVTFDGFLVTPVWRIIADPIPRASVPFVATTALMGVGLGMFVSTYVDFSKWMRKVAASSLKDRYLARRFALSLLPIAIGYHVSHYYTFLLLQAQFFVPALSDPFGVSWNLLGIGGFEPVGKLPFLSVELVWQTQIALIIAGHVISVWVAHRIALAEFRDRRQAVKSQLPMLVLMVLYTMMSLWILTQPVIEPPLP